MKLSIYSYTNQGGREHNEDSLRWTSDGTEGVFVLADGLGGHDRGEVASQLAVEVICGGEDSPVPGREALLERFRQANARILEQQKQPGQEEMKTTAVALSLSGGTAAWAHIGDSRLYRFERGKLAERTLDHSVPQMLVAAGEIKEKQIRHHPDRNRLLRVMGVNWEEPRYQLGGPVPASPGQAFLLCSDGFWEWIEEKKMLSALKKADSPEDWISRMEEMILKQGRGKNMDNYSAIAVWVD